MEKAFSEILKAAMTEQNLSCDKLARMTGTSNMSVSYYRSGRISPPIDTADKILKVLNITMTLGK